MRRHLASTLTAIALIAPIALPGIAMAEKLPPEPLVPNNSLITKTPEEGRALAITPARHSIHAMQNDLDTLKGGRPKYANDPVALIAAGHVIAVEFATIAAANNCWRGTKSAAVH